MKKIFFFFLTILCASGSLLAQNCFVNVDSLKGEYKGGCSNGKAEGKGTAAGADSYTGDFKNGYPDGWGKYNWRNGNWYEGFWRHGRFQGNGTLIKKGDNPADSIIVQKGYWEKGNFLGTHEKNFYVEQLTNNFNDVSVRKVDTIKPEISISVKSITGGASNINRPVLPKPEIVNIQVLEGRFEQMIADTVSRISSRYMLRGVKFPFSAIFTFHTAGPALWVEKAKVELYENGNWNIRFEINN